MRRKITHILVLLFQERKAENIKKPVAEWKTMCQRESNVIIDQIRERDLTFCNVTLLNILFLSNWFEIGNLAVMKSFIPFYVTVIIATKLPFSAIINLMCSHRLMFWSVCPTTTTGIIVYYICYPMTDHIFWLQIVKNQYTFTFLCQRLVLQVKLDFCCNVPKQIFKIHHFQSSLINLSSRQ